jgi:hypothetical protein
MIGQLACLAVQYNDPFLTAITIDSLICKFQIILRAFVLNSLQQLADLPQSDLSYVNPGNRIDA